VRGGFWRNRYDRSHARPLAAALAEAGWMVLLPEYRRLGDPGGGSPGTFDDIAALIAAVASLVPAELRRRVTLVGHSAGGHLAVRLQASAPSPVIDAVGVARGGGRPRRGGGEGVERRGRR
jgi:acetyl esterase/lipase